MDESKVKERAPAVFRLQNAFADQAVDAFRVGYDRFNGDETFAGAKIESERMITMSLGCLKCGEPHKTHPAREAAGGHSCQCENCHVMDLEEVEQIISEHMDKCAGCRLHDAADWLLAAYLKHAPKAPYERGPIDGSGRND